MQIIVSQEQGKAPVTVLKLAGQLDGQTYQNLIAQAQELYKGGTQNILLDMEELTYISSAGLVSLHTIALLLRGETPPDPEQGWSAFKSMDKPRDGGSKNIKLLNPRPEIVSVLDMVGFSAFFEIFTDKQKALESF
ncbi:MAG: STAS domain-containing protein [Anaerolineales bacterium]|nr:STAS domain-containing protein [Anaerolineales bacterium]WKZ40811.1 MAG: STAS domain-containing protein [Anaerolineales bacterium]